MSQTTYKIDPSPVGFIEAFKASIANGIHDQNYKSGAFKSSIPRSMPPIEALKILRGSSLVTADEKVPIAGCQCLFDQLAIKLDRDTIMSNYQHVLNLASVFKKRRPESRYVHP
jgi:hypothetical protein